MKEKARKRKGTDKFRVYVARRIPQTGIDLMRKSGIDVEVNMDENKVLSRKELLRKIKGKDGLLSLLTDKVDSDVIGSSPNLKIIANYAVGFDNIDVRTATENGVVVTNTPGVLTETVAEHAIALMAAAARRVVEADKFTRQGKFKAWGPMLFLGQDMKGKTLGIIGLGRIGSAVAERAARGFGMNVVYTKRTRNLKFEKKYGTKFVNLRKLLKVSDFISIHVPLTSATRHMIGAKEFALMKRNAVVVNTARGPIINEKALVSALKSNRIFAAALDVFECEPAVTCDAKARNQLKDLDNVILTPHIASASVEARELMSEMAGRSIVDFAKGRKPENVVNKEVLKKALRDRSSRRQVI